MGDSLRQIGRNLRNTQRDVEFLSRRGGFLPALDRTRGNLTQSSAFNAKFDTDQKLRFVGLRITFYKASIL